MLKTLASLTGAALLAASTALLAQQGTPAPDAGKAPRRFDCSQAKDPTACQDRRDKARAAFKKAQTACEGKQGTERRDCMRTQMCSSAQDPAKCEARVKEIAAKRAQAFEACKDKKGDELRACMREQRRSPK